MKKLLTVLALALMTVMIAVSAVGCGADTAKIEKTVEELTDRIEELEKKNNDLTKQIKDLNVFRAGKKEYSQTETMTIYFGQTAAFKIRLVNDFRWSGTNGINNSFYLTSLCSDILVDTIATATYLSWDNGTYMRKSSLDDTLAKQGVEKRVGGYYEGDGAAYNDVMYFDFVICIPGTLFELARFKNVIVTK